MRERETYYRECFLLSLSALAGSQVVNKNEPMFVSRSEAFKFAVGDVITLPCQVTHPGNIFLNPSLPFFFLAHTLTSCDLREKKIVHAITFFAES